MPAANLPVPPGPVAPLSARYFWDVAPPALITLAYRTILPARLRGRWVKQGSCSHIALRVILAGGGWRAFWYYARPAASISGPDTRWIRT